MWQLVPNSFVVNLQQRFGIKSSCRCEFWCFLNLFDVLLIHLATWAEFQMHGLFLGVLCGFSW